MIPAHTAIYSQLTQPMAALLAAQLLRQGLIDTDALPEQLETLDGPTVAQFCQKLSHAQVVMSLSRETSPLALDTMEVLLQRPIYLCARGETSEPLTDYLGRPLPIPTGVRRGAPQTDTVAPARPAPRMHASNPRRDTRIIESVVPNPKRAGSAAHARYELYSPGITVEQAIASGVTRADVRWDAKQGFIVLAVPSA